MLIQRLHPSNDHHAFLNRGIGNIVTTADQGISVVDSDDDEERQEGAVSYANLLSATLSLGMVTTKGRTKVSLLYLTTTTKITPVTKT